MANKNKLKSKTAKKNKINKTKKVRNGNVKASRSTTMVKSNPSNPGISYKPTSNGGGIGATLGGLAGDAISRIFGFGDYSVEHNSLIGSDVPVFSKADAGTIRLRNREFIQEINSSVTFAVQSFMVNPGVVTTFPFLSQIAANYEQYVIHGLVFYYRSLSANMVSGSNTALGAIIMAAEYNAAAPNFTSKFQMENYEFAVSGKPSEDVMFPLECAPEASGVRHLNVRSAAVPSGQDVKTYDFANFQLATLGSQAASDVGELWVSYDVELLKPRLFNTLGSNLGVYGFTNTAGITQSQLFGTGGGTLSANNNLLLTLGATTITFPATSAPGTGYVIAIEWITTSGAQTVPAPTATTNISFPTMGGAQTNYFAANAGATCTRVLLTMTAVIGNTGAAPVITYTGAAFTSVSNVYLSIYQINSSVL